MLDCSSSSERHHNLFPKPCSIDGPVKVWFEISVCMDDDDSDGDGDGVYDNYDDDQKRDDDDDDGGGGDGDDSD